MAGLLSLLSDELDVFNFNDRVRRDGMGNEWQELDTVPRDGTPVDLWSKFGYRQTDTWWDDEDKYWSCCQGDEHFTHWMKIPEPPINI